MAVDNTIRKRKTIEIQSNQKLFEYKPYAGIGSRRTPFHTLLLMQDIAKELCRKGYVLRSGRAPGADCAFEKGSNSASNEIYLPWRRFNDSESSFYQPSEAAFKIAKSFHPIWDHLPQSIQKLMARNVHQILGQNLKSPSLFVICWTPDGCEHFKDRTARTGGTGQAIAIASKYNVPVFNLKNESSKEAFFEQYLNGAI